MAEEAVTDTGAEASNNVPGPTAATAGVATTDNTPSQAQQAPAASTSQAIQPLNLNVSQAGAVASTSNGPSQATASSSTSLNSIEDICNAIHTITTSGGDAQAQYNLVAQSLLPALRSFESRDVGSGMPAATILTQALPGNIDPLHVLLQQVPQSGIGLGYLYILVARCWADNAVQQAGYLIPLVLQYIERADIPQMRLVPHKVEALANGLCRLMHGQPANAVAPLLRLNGNFQGEYRQHFLTAVHAPLLYSALLAGAYNHVVPLLLNSPVSDVDTRSFPVTYQDNLKYHLYGGTILGTVGHYELAKDMLETAVAAPCHTGATSLIQVDAYKQLILIQLLADGKTAPPPKYTSPAVLATFKQLYTTPYLEFAKAYEKLEVYRVVELLNKHHKIFEQDGTEGLALRCMQMIPARRMIRLSSVYKSIGLEDVVQLIDIMKTEANAAGENVGLVLFTEASQAKEAIKRIVQGLVAEKKLLAAVQPAQAPAQGEYLQFQSTHMSQAESAAALQRTISLLRNSSWKISNLDKSISSSRDFLGKAHAAMGRTGGMGGGVGGGMDHGFDPSGFMAEEELIGDRDSHGADIWDD